MYVTKFTFATNLLLMTCLALSISPGSHRFRCSSSSPNPRLFNKRQCGLQQPICYQLPYRTLQYRPHCGLDTHFIIELRCPWLVMEANFTISCRDTLRHCRFLVGYHVLGQTTVWRVRVSKSVVGVWLELFFGADERSLVGPSFTLLEPTPRSRVRVTISSTAG